MNTRGFGPFSQFYELLHTVLGSIESQFWHLLKHVDLVLSGSFMSYYILFSGLSTVLRSFLSFMKSRGFGPFSQLYELLHTVLGSLDSFEGISAIYKIHGFGPFS